MELNDPCFNQLKNNVLQFVDLSEEELHDASLYFNRRLIKKKSHWLRQGAFCTEVIFVTRGCLRYYHATNDSERSIEFIMENCWYTDLESWLKKAPAVNGVDALEDTEVLAISFHDLLRLYDKYPRYERIGRLIAENIVIEISTRYNSLINDTPTKRYLKMMEENPALIDRIPQHYIASYLGIEPESLSRIRKRISFKPTV
jgi:CRP/FNR family transcriptional regulator, anaerobic regulatory protein